MAENPPPPSSMPLHARKRIFGEDPDNVTVEAPSVSSSPEAMKVLKEQGVDAWRAWVADHATPEV